MLRSKLFAGLVLVAGLVVTGLTPAATAAPGKPVLVTTYHHTHFVLFYRAHPNHPWTRYSAFATRGDAERVAHHLHGRGLHIKIVAVKG